LYLCLLTWYVATEPLAGSLTSGPVTGVASPDPVGAVHTHTACLYPH
jgi:hypothetical protein